MDTRPGRTRASALALTAVLAASLALTACGGGKDAEDHKDGGNKRPRPGSSAAAAPRDSAVPVKPTKKDPRGVPGAPQNVPIPWRR
ncbi:hypothetical protein [Yinghuangia sp. YIM S09857]|uniref:hypothetical protein n=1 Tax=Yinghuangia sp. YIM S09857 TaxID=3436929 RepID=UPI003F53A063